ncbi:hypothetical protein L210DRAFT_3519599 [Boletus edulis BED1]|uniref:Uncharacterized protein n=1 Tax=Boletus edulis BED1 TaxID=1328754 RepID=A0AAD4CAK6_BOLED|nr:hypothetical protein L210DRAFT_3519599 [Boletus edulis BED1]
MCYTWTMRYNWASWVSSYIVKANYGIALMWADQGEGPGHRHLAGRGRSPTRIHFSSPRLTFKTSFVFFPLHILDSIPLHSNDYIIYQTRDMHGRNSESSAAQMPPSSHQSTMHSIGASTPTSNPSITAAATPAQSHQQHEHGNAPHCPSTQAVPNEIRTARANQRFLPRHVLQSRMDVRPKRLFVQRTRHRRPS